MAGLAQGHAGVLAVLFDVMGVRRARGIADGAGQLFDQGEMPALLCVDLVVHSVALSTLRLLAS